MAKEGYIQQLVKYIKKNLAKGYTIEALKWSLINQGYSKTEFEKALTLVNQELARELPPVPEKPVITVETIPPQQESKGLWATIKGWFG
jgi:hypothetical protein